MAHRKHAGTTSSNPSISVDPTTVPEGSAFTIAWTGATGGFLHIEDACRRLYVNTGSGDGSYTDHQPTSDGFDAACTGPASVTLEGADGSVLASAAYEVVA